MHIDLNHHIFFFLTCFLIQLTKEFFLFPNFQLEESPYTYELHVQLITLCRKLGDLDRLRVAREKMSDIFPLTPGLYFICNINTLLIITFCIVFIFYYYAYLLLQSIGVVNLLKSTSLLQRSPYNYDFDKVLTRFIYVPYILIYITYIYICLMYVSYI